MNRLINLMIIVGLLTSASCSKKEVPAPVVTESANYVAQVDKLENSVATKAAKTFEWVDIILGHKLSNYDSIRTGDGSHAQITFDDGSRIEMDQNSLVLILEKKLRERSLSLPQGKIDGFVSDETSGLVVKTPSGWVKASGKNGKAKFKVAVKDKITSVESVSGEVKVQTKEKTHDVIPGKELKLEATNESRDADLEQVPSASVKVAIPVTVNTFAILEPSTKEFSTSDKTVTFSGELIGDYQVYLNGKKLVSDSQGKFSHEMALQLGVNVFTFQIVMGDKVSYDVFKIVRQN